MRVGPLVVAAALVGGAVAVHVSTPSQQDRNAPFVESVDVGDWGQGRTFGVRVEDVVLANEVTDGDWVGTTGGVWVVVTLTAEAALAPGSIHGSLHLGDLSFDASERAGSSSLDGVTLSPGLAEGGDLVFEVSRAALRDHGGAALLHLSTLTNPRLDSVVEVPLDLGGLEPEGLHELAAVERASR